jgi:hypothetical protein
VESTDGYDILSSDLGNWVTIPWYGFVVLDPAKVYFVSVKHFGGALPVYIGYGSNPSAGSVLSNDGDGSAWSGQPRAMMIRLNVDNGLSVSDQTVDSFLMAPNPSSDFVSIQFMEELNSDIEVSVLDAMGKMINTQKFSNVNSKLEMNVSNLSTGVYSVKITTNNGASTQQLVVK